MTEPLLMNAARCTDGEFVLTAAGEIDMNNVDTFSQALNVAVADAVSGGGSLVVDLSAVKYLDSSAINVLCSRAHDIARLIAHPLLVTVLRISGLSELVAVHSASATTQS